MRGISWRFRCQLQCLGRSGEESTRKLVEYVFIVEADESTRWRLGGILHKDHEDHIAGKEINSSKHYNFVHTFVLMSKALNIPDAKAAVDTEWESREKHWHGS